MHGPGTSQSLLVSWMRHTPTVASHKVVVVVVVAAAAALAARTAPVTRQRLICTLYASRLASHPVLVAAVAAVVRSVAAIHC